MLTNEPQLPQWALPEGYQYPSNKPQKKDEPKTDIPPQSLKNKYQTYKGSIDGIEEWIKGQQDKGHNFKYMEQVLATALNKRVQEEKQA